MGKRNNKEEIFRGTGVFPGVAIGKALLLETPGLSFTPRRISHLLTEAEISRLREALKETKEELLDIRERLLSKGLRKEASFVDVHLQILEDRMLMEEVEEAIREELVNAEWALEMTMKRLLGAFETMDEDYIRERGQDIRQVLQRVLRHLLGYPPPTLQEVGEGVVVVAHDLAPGDVAQLDVAEVKGFATDVGSTTSHTAIVAKSLGIPAVVALRELSSRIKGGETVIIDGQEGTVIVNPSAGTLREYELRRQHYRFLVRELLKYAPLPSETLDGYPLALRANIEFVHEASVAKQYGAEGIGLYRTEYLFLGRVDLPSEEEHFHSYRQLVTEVSPHPATIRTFDLGGEKQARSIGIPKERNPALGLKGIRLALKEKEAFRTQLRAILRASHYGRVRILLPMICCLQELREAKDLIEKVKEDLSRDSIPFDPHVEVGVMIEVPSSALITDLLAQEADFLSIGTNDLIQYTLAIDRQNENVAYLYQPLHPAILRLMEVIVQRAHEAGKEVGVCGEVASDPFYSLVFLGMGMDELSMAPSAIPRIKRVLRKATQELGRSLLKEVLKAQGDCRREAALRQELAKLFPEDFVACQA